MLTLDHITSTFKTKFQHPPEVVIGVSGRANIIGEHTDYNEGFVFPFATQQKIFFCGSKSDEPTSSVYALDTEDTYQESENKSGWSFLFYNIKTIFKERYGIDKSIRLCFGGNLPIGAGISSSSAVCCGIIEIYDHLFGLNLTPSDKVNISSEAEHGIGLKGGKMDQYAIVNGTEHHALLLDCRSMGHEDVTLPDGWQFLLLHSGVKHNLVETQYNTRRQQCEEALSILNTRGNHFQSLREVTLEYLRSQEFPEVKPFHRALHVLEENQRVHAFKEAMLNQDIVTCGALLFLSHYSLKDLYEVSCGELDFLVQLSEQSDFIYGGRMMGGGFGGCTINLVKAIDEKGLHEINAAFNAKYGYEPTAIAVQPSQGITYF